MAEWRWKTFRAMVAVAAAAIREWGFADSLAEISGGSVGGAATDLCLIN